MDLVDYIEPGTNLSTLQYLGIGEAVYADGRQVMVRGCHDAYVSFPNEEGEKGIVLVKRISEPANGYVWALGGGIIRGTPTLQSLAIKIKEESGLDIINPILIDIDRYMWKETPNQRISEKNLPSGIDDLTLIFYCEGKGELTLNKLHKSPIIVTKSMYTDSFRNNLHPSIRKNMDLAMHYLK